MRKRAAQELNPEMGRMGAEDPATVLRPTLKACFDAAALGKDTSMQIQIRAELRIGRKSDLCRRP
jgi:hypothetical protein